MAYVGTPIDTTNTFTSLQGKRFNGDGSATDFTLDVAPSSTLDIEVFVGNVRQDPNSAYTLSGTTLTFSAAPPTGTRCPSRNKQRRTRRTAIKQPNPR